MDNKEKRELAAKMAAQRSGQGKRKPLPTAQPSKTQSSLSFFGDEGDGWMMSPKTILLFSVAYMGCVILLHIFAKVTSIKQTTAQPGATPDPSAEAGAGAGAGGDL